MSMEFNCENDHLSGSYSVESDQLFSIGRRSSGSSMSVPAPQYLDDFLEAVPETFSRTESQSYIGQWSGIGKRSTCMIAARLNGLIGLGAISTVEAEQAHSVISTDRGITWSKAPQGYLVPGISSTTFPNVFNRPGTLPVITEFSDSKNSKEIPSYEKVNLFGKAVIKRVAIVLGRRDTNHAIVAIPVKSNKSQLEVVDSRTPHDPYQLSINQTIDYLEKDQSSEIQLVFARPK